MATPIQEKEFASDKQYRLPRTFVARRLHSLLGLWLAIYLFEHLLINSQAALYFHDDGAGFISMVNKIHALPYLKLIEITVLGLPFLLHAVWGIAYLRSSKLNSTRTKGDKPALPQYGKNRAFSWQRITSWILLVGIIAHVIHMRFVDYPEHVHRGDVASYLIVQKKSKMLYMMQEKLGLTLYDKQALAEKKKELIELKSTKEKSYALQDRLTEDREWLTAATKKPLKEDELLVSSPSAGTAFLLIVRDAFTHPMIVILYSILVIAACFHGYNGLWTALITWGVAVTRRSQKRLRQLSYGLMLLVMFLGLFAAWGSYFL